MRGHLRKRGERSWAVVVDVGHDPRTGKRRQKWVSVKGTKRDAERRLVEVIRDLNEGINVDTARITLANYLDQWIRDYVAFTVRETTLEGYRNIVRRLKRDLGRIDLADLNPQQVQRYYAELMAGGLSAQTVIHLHNLLYHAIAQAVKWDMLPRNVLEAVSPPRLQKPEFRSLNPSEVDRLLSAARGTDYHLPIHLAIYTGLRRSEVLGLRWSDVDLGTKTLTVRRSMVAIRGAPGHIAPPKSRASRRVVSYGELTEALLRSRRAAPDAQVCARPDGSELRPGSLTHGYRRIADSHGIDVRFHDLRHTHASLLLASGVPVHVVRARLGHESIQTTVDTYGHVLPASEASATLERALEFAECLQNQFEEIA